MPAGEGKTPPQIVEKQPRIEESRFKRLFIKLKKRRIIETLAAFIGGGWLLIEVVERLLVDHYEFPRASIDLTVISVIGALLATIVWRWFGGTDKRPGNIKVEVLLVPLIILVVLAIDLILILQIAGFPGKRPLIAIIGFFFGVVWIIFKLSQWASSTPDVALIKSGISKLDGTKPEKSIVVLPFKNIGPEEKEEYLSDGMTEEIITDLSNIHDLRVISRSTAMLYKVSQKSVTDIAKELDVQYVLEGSVRKAGNDLRITAQLIDARNDAHLWAEKLSGTMDDVFTMQEKISRSIVDALKPKLMPAEERPITRITVKSNRKKLLLPAAGLVIILAAVLIMPRFLLKKNILPSASGKPLLAVMYFENRTGEPDLEKNLADMLITKLYGNDKIEVISTQRIFDILNELKKPVGGAIDTATSTEIATRAHANMMLLGSIIKLSDKIRIIAQLTDVQSGKLMKSDQVDGKKVGDVFGMADDLAEKVMTWFGVSAAAGQRPSISDMTTNSYEAYTYYQKGLDRLWKWGFAEAAENLKKATEIDPSFAAAYVNLALAQTCFGLNLFYPLWDDSPIRETMSAAKKYIDKASEKERLHYDFFQTYINGERSLLYSSAENLVRRFPQDKYSYMFLGSAAYLNFDFEKCRDANDKLLEIDPTDGNGYNMLAYSYSFLKDYPRAVSTIKKYIAVLPDNENSYLSAWEICALAGLYDEAVAWIEEGQKRLPRNSWYYQLFQTRLLQGQAEKAREEIRRYMDLEPGQTIFGARSIGTSYLLEGRFKEAESEFRRAVSLAQKEKRGVLTALLDLGKMLAAGRRYDDAIRTYKEAAEISSKNYPEDFNPGRILAVYLTGMAFVDKGDFKAARNLAGELETVLKKGRYRLVHWDYAHLLNAAIFIGQKNTLSGQKDLDNIMGWSKLYSPYYNRLAAALMDLQGQSEKAIEAYERNFYRNIGMGMYGVGDNFELYFGRSRADYVIAKIYEKTGNRARAAEYYEKFLGLMKNADPGIPEVEDARKRLAAPKGP